MGISAENSLWYKGKGEVLREFKKSTGAILSAVASRNFSNMPGFAIEAFSDVEIESKFKLTEYNQKIMSDAIDRELKVLGLENDISLKQATMAWELEKMQLFSDLQTEFADKELIRSLRGEEIDGLMIDQEIREIGVLMSKVAIEIEIEGIKRQKEGVGLLPLPYEEQLAMAKLETARRKLDAIPYILASLAAQSTALHMEETVILPARQAKANLDTQVANATTTELLPLMTEKAIVTASLTTELRTLFEPLRLKALASSELAAVMTSQLANHRLLAMEKVTMANEKVLRLNEEITLMGKEITLDGKKITAERDRAALELQRARAKVEIVDALRTQLGEIKTAMAEEAAAEIVYINTQGSNEVAIRKSRLEKVEAERYAASAKEILSQTSAVIRMGDADRAHSIAMANKTAGAHITEKLIHLLG
jgi:hypothetical protein